MDLKTQIKSVTIGSNEDDPGATSYTFSVERELFDVALAYHQAMMDARRPSIQSGIGFSVQALWDFDEDAEWAYMIFDGFTLRIQNQTDGWFISVDMANEPDGDDQFDGTLWPYAPSSTAWVTVSAIMREIARFQPPMAIAA